MFRKLWYRRILPFHHYRPLPSRQRCSCRCNPRDMERSRSRRHCHTPGRTASCYSGSPRYTRPPGYRCRPATCWKKDILWRHSSINEYFKKCLVKWFIRKTNETENVILFQLQSALTQFWYMISLSRRNWFLRSWWKTRPRPAVPRTTSVDTASSSHGSLAWGIWWVLPQEPFPQLPPPKWPRL